MKERHIRLPSKASPVRSRTTHYSLAGRSRAKLQQSKTQNSFLISASDGCSTSHMKSELSARLTQPDCQDLFDLSNNAPTTRSWQSPPTFGCSLAEEKRIQSDPLWYGAPRVFITDGESEDRALRRKRAIWINFTRHARRHCMCRNLGTAEVTICMIPERIV